MGDNAFYRMELEGKVSELTRQLAERTRQLTRANKLIGWMMPYIGTMCPPANGLYDLNIHCCENKVPEPDKTSKGRPINQRPNLPNPTRRRRKS